MATVTVTDGDADVVSQQSTSSGLSLTFDDTDPTLEITAPVTVGAAEVVEASGAGGQGQVTITPPSFTASAVDGYTTDVGYALALAGAAATGLVTTDGNHAITLVVDSATQISGKYDSDGNASLDATHAGGRLGHPDLGQVRQRRQCLARCDGVHGDAVGHDGDADVAGCA
ncbi:hypothetical protein X726_24965 [Mesorhizobium sp. L103C105A0]|nr:hypothetical protein X726_24965 [Mesorhizobium sp. L103C105A0]